METSAVSANIPETPTRYRRWLRTTLLSVSLVLLVCYIGISTYAALTLTTPRRAPITNTPATVAAAYRDVQFPARGSEVTIAGWYLPQSTAEHALILVHGKDSSRSTEFGGHFVDLAAGLQQQGFAVLMIDLRGHGASGDGRFSFGIEERYDILGAVDWLGQQGFVPQQIGVLGVSMGAASAIGAMATEPALGALVSDCSYAEVEPLMQMHWTEASHLPDVFLPATLLIGQIIVGEDLTASNPVDEIDDLANRPVLIIHGKNDQFTPLEHAHQLAAADPHAQLWEVPGAAHAGSFSADPAGYLTRVSTFFERSLQ